MFDALLPLRALSFYEDVPDGLSPEYLDWLLLDDSMTKRLEQYCSNVSICLVREGFFSKDSDLPGVEWLPAAERYWLREVIFSGDDEPWLLGRTILPESTLEGAEFALQHVGNTPLGRYLFNGSSLTRDFIHIGRSADMWGRRSRLRLSGNPLLLTELFLPASPFYQGEQ